MTIEIIEEIATIEIIEEIFEGPGGISGYSGFSGLGISGYSGFSGLGVSGYSGYSGSADFLYIAYASDDQGTDFALTFISTLDYIAILNSEIEIANPQASDFTGLWKRYVGADGTGGVATYSFTPDGLTATFTHASIKQDEYDVFYEGHPFNRSQLTAYADGTFTLPFIPEVGTSLWVWIYGGDWMADVAPGTQTDAENGSGTTLLLWAAEQLWQATAAYVTSVVGWTKETATTSAKLLFKEGTNNGNGGITLKGQDATGIVTITLPNSTGTLALAPTPDLDIGGKWKNGNYIGTGDALHFYENIQDHRVELTAPHTLIAHTVVELPSIAGTLVVRDAVETLTNKTLSAWDEGSENLDATTVAAVTLDYDVNVKTILADATGVSLTLGTWPDKACSMTVQIVANPGGAITWNGVLGTCVNATDLPATYVAKSLFEIFKVSDGSTGFLYYVFEVFAV